MTPELLSAVKDRIEAGQDKAGIMTAVLEAGYTRDEFTEVYARAQVLADVPTTVEAPSVDPESTSTSGAEESESAAPEEVIETEVLETPETPETSDTSETSEEVVRASTSSAPTKPESEKSSLEKYELPNAFAIIKQGFGFVFARIGLTLSILFFAVLYTIAPAVIWYAQEIYGADSYLFGITSAIVTAVIIIAVFLYIWRLLATLYIVAQPDPKAVSLRNGLRWVNRNFFGLIWLWIIMLLVTTAGYLLFIIPGIVLGIYFYFAGAVYAAEGTGGFAALARSHQLIKKRWWSLLLKVVWLAILMFIFALPLYVLILGGATVLSGNSAWLGAIDVVTPASLLVNILLQVIAVVWSIVGTYAYVALYKAAAAARPAVYQAPKRRWFIALAVLGLIVALPILGFIGMAVFTLNQYGVLYT